MKSFLDELDHPLMFIIFVLLAVVAAKGLMKWVFTSLNMPGPAALFA